MKLLHADSSCGVNAFLHERQLLALHLSCTYRPCFIHSFSLDQGGMPSPANGHCSGELRPMLWPYVDMASAR